MKKQIFITMFLILISSVAQARIEILISSASDKKFPVAVPSFMNAGGGRAGGNAVKMAQLLQKDLIVSGIFDVVTDKQLPHADTDTTQIDFKKWQALEVGALVKGVVDKEGGETVIQLRLYDVAAGKMLMGKQYTVDAKNYIDAVHRFMDSLMQSLTGYRGPFESKIAASCGKPFHRKIMSFEMDGARIAGLAGGTNAISPNWSPDGSRVAYTAFNSKFPEIYVSGKQITSFYSTTITPAWTPDGGSLVVASAKSGDTDLYQISLSGQVIRQITASPNIDLAPSFSPDGSHIVFSSERSGGLQLFQTSIGGGGASQMTFIGYQNDQADWAPDGSKIVFTSRDRGAFDIFLMEADGSNIMRLTRDEGNNESPSWAPDSRYIVYSSSRGAGLYVMLDDGTGQIMIPKSSGCVNPDWSPWLTKDEQQ